MRCGSFPPAGELSNNPLCLQLTAEPKVLSEVLAVVQRGISTFLIRHSGLTVASGARTGAVTLIQRLGSQPQPTPRQLLLRCSTSCIPASLQSCTCCSWGAVRFGGAGLYLPRPAHAAGRHCPVASQPEWAHRAFAGAALPDPLATGNFSVPFLAELRTKLPWDLRPGEFCYAPYSRISGRGGSHGRFRPRT